MGSTGHSYMRVGRKIYDFAFSARANDFHAPTGNAYGFSMAATPNNSSSANVETKSPQWAVFFVQRVS